MIAHLRGKLEDIQLDKDLLRLVVDVQGVGYEVITAKSNETFLQKGQAITLFIRESVTAFDGATTFYGFLTREEKQFFDRIRDKVEGMGPRKALECIEKINKSLPDFKRAVIDEDMRILESVFGFTKKTAEKLVFALKDQAGGWFVPGQAKWVDKPKSSEEAEAISGLVNLGYRDDEAREAVQKAKDKLGGKGTVQTILQESLRNLGVRKMSV